MLSEDITVDEFCAGLANLYISRKYIMLALLYKRNVTAKTNF